MNHKDLFSGHARIYSAFRPTYPEELYAFIFRQLQKRDTAWDCATGNGQVAQYLSHHFKEVFATDISEQQLQEAPRDPTIRYSVGAAEKTAFHENQFDLVTVGQALHWFDHGAFYNEVKRVARPGALLAAWGYSVLSIDPELDTYLLDFYKNTVGPYWDSARRLVDEKYQTLSFPFEEIPSPEFFIRVSWTLEHLAGYLETWSATQKYIKTHNTNPVVPLTAQLAKHWKRDESKTVSFPVFLRLGRV
jgi:ubiquinone/menaquinone biosynthesis C-methylase UbiE